jgi:hypothetical protein
MTAAAAHTDKDGGFFKLTEAVAGPYRLVRCKGSMLEVRPAAEDEGPAHEREREREA